MVHDKENYVEPPIRRHDEYQYLKLIDEIISRGAKKGDRTGGYRISEKFDEFPLESF